MPPRAAILYVWEKYRYEKQFTDYLMDMLWAQACGRTFTDDKHNTTYPRWHDIDNPQKEQHKRQVTKEDVKLQFARLKTKTQ